MVEKVKQLESMTEKSDQVQTLRLATSSDSASLASLHFLSHTKSFRPYASKDWTNSRELMNYERDWRIRCEDTQFHTWIIELQTRIAGMVSFGPGPAYKAEEDFGEVSYFEGMHVHPDFMRKGLGRILLRKAKQDALNKNYSVVYLHVMEANAPAKDLFKSEGFLPVERLPTGDEGVPIILCRCDLKLGS